METERLQGIQFVDEVICRFVDGGMSKLLPPVIQRSQW